MMAGLRFGSFPRPQCTKETSHGSTFLAPVFFSVYIVVNALVILSLFVGVICTGMFKAITTLEKEKMEAERRQNLQDVTDDLKKEEFEFKEAAVVTVKKKDSKDSKEATLVSEQSDGSFTVRYTEGDQLESGINKEECTVEDKNVSKTKQMLDTIMDPSDVLGQDKNDGKQSVLKQLSEFALMVTHDGTRPVLNIHDQSLRETVDKENGMENELKTTKLTQMWTSTQKFFRESVVPGKYKDDQFEERHISSKVFNNTIAVTILLVAVSAGLRADGLATDEDLAWFNMLTLLIFTVEVVLKFFAAHYSLMTYLSSDWNKLDFVIVVEGWLTQNPSQRAQ